jgi:hypothetical protein
MAVIDAVECRSQVRVQHPPPDRVLPVDGVEDGLDRVLAAASGPKPIRSRLEPGFPFRLQRGRHPSLQDPVDDHGNAERTTPAVRFRDIHPSDRTGLPGLLPTLDSIRQRGFVLAVEDDPAVQPAVKRPALISVTRRIASSVFDRDRSINFCRSRTRLWSCACDAVKIRCRRRRT